MIFIKYLFKVLFFILILKSVSLSRNDDEFAEFERDPDAELDSEVQVDEIPKDDGFVEEEGFVEDVQSNEPNTQTENVNEEDQDEFDPYSDEEEFEGYNKDKTNKPKTQNTGGLKITKVPVHLRSGWQAFYFEILTMIGIIVYAANFYTGKTKNSKLATAWFKAHKPLLEQHFSIVGDDGMSKEPQSGVLVKESESVYTLWCTGRQYCEGMLVELRLLKRHDIVSIISQMMRPRPEIVKITVYMDDEDMDNFVFSLLPKKQASKYHKDLQDLAFFCGEKKSADRYELPNFSILSESGEVSDFVLSTQVCNVIKKYENCFESLHFSDQFVGQKKEDGDEEGTAKLKKPKKVLIFEFKIPGNGRTRSEDMAATEGLVKMVLLMIDRVKGFRLSQQARLKSDKKRREVEQNFLKQQHSQRQEASQARREEKLRLEKERLMAEEDPEKQKRMEEIMSKRDAKKRGPKVKSMKVRM
ncbi:PAT complex subunit CCDC47 isoform X1 [Hydra vulgaris]|uniref:PAT complex subunit CCDC47 isoform X1 n=1 Tax=Hydra vulgaris TaxID=6087 RepID=UPI00019272CE|nr:coiled-coil domain-containing protein 47 [Hydra vulgaris]